MRVWSKLLILPPAGPLLVALAALVVDLDLVALVAVASLWALATPALGLRLLAILERRPPWSAAESRAEAIVVLDAGRLLCSDSFSAGAIVKLATLARLRTAAEIARATGLPLLASGDGAAELMAEVLRDDFAVEPRWLETESRDTAESARQVAAILAAEGIQRIVLVTHGWHLPRAVRAFERVGLVVEPAPAAASGPDRWERGAMALVPSVRGLQASHAAIHESLGLVVYALRARFSFQRRLFREP